ncbi:DUF6161 domain-containing protein [Lentibacillus saliphilus]|uniref:DUF6161 domain-containing protein n=1 Tax=Lentibacillus saliphilus TaxID=2737028 RepID=UPI001C2F6BF8|nr:DUF6161 domain-containing protein [Lentibacillus saliphilus]
MTQAVDESKKVFSKETKDYFKSFELTFTLYPDNQTKSYKSLDHFYSFIQNEVDFWRKCTTGKPSAIRSHFVKILNWLDQIYNYNFQNQDSAIKNNMRQVINNIKANRYPCVFSITSRAKFIKEQYEIHPQFAESACEYLLNISGNSTLQLNMNDKYIFKGLIDSYLYEYPQTTKSIFKNEQESLYHLKTDYNDSLNKLDNEYYEKMKYLDGNTSKYQSDLITWKEDLQNTTESFVEDKELELENLVSLYEEKLKLEGPAKYWEETKDQYKKIGKRWMITAVSISISFITFLTILLLKLTINDTELNLNSIKMMFILTVIISIGIFVINFFIRLSTSAYHLSRDAHERHQLAYVYLALLKDKSVEESDRSIVLQSLFSRADTGLLKGESSPSLPDGLLGQALKNMNTKQ